jgi:UDP-MurNAc hydroxylase
LDSLLAVTDGQHTVINLNDTDVPDSDLRRLRRHVGDADVILNQFSIAGFDGYLDAAGALKREAEQKLRGMISAHRLLGASYTVPFASFVYFSAVDNRFINQFANSIGDVQKAFDAAGLNTVVLRPGDEYRCGAAWDNRPSTEYLQNVFDTTLDAEFDTPPLIAVDQLEKTFTKFQAVLSTCYPAFLLRRIGRIRFHLQDLSQTIECNFCSGEFHLLGPGRHDPDIELYSQPLQFGLATPFGFETLGVSGRFRVLKNRRRWRMLKIVSILLNQEVRLKLPHLLDRRTLGYLLERLRANLLGQVLLKRQQRNALT